MTNSDFSKCECRHCAGPVEFPVEAGGQTIACPHCGQAMVLPGRKAEVSTKIRGLSVRGLFAVWVMIVVATVVFAFLKSHFMASTTGKSPEKSVATVVPTAVKSEDGTTTNGFAVSTLKLEKTPGSSLVYVMGTVKNVTDKQRFGVKAEFSLSDSNGVSAGLASDYVASLDPHGVWKFKALVMGSKATHATLNSVREDQ